MCLIVGLCAAYFLRAKTVEPTEDQLREQAEQQAIDDFLEQRRASQLEGTDVDPFGDDDLVRVLLVGLDSRAGDSAGHCDAIQLFEINRESQTVNITAVPRGTYSPLPPGTGTTSTDYYVSNACGLGGLKYGIGQIERILGKKADHLVIVGFSETLGILRYLKLPTTETLQWLRHRQGYAIGEPQRARNHSTFLKEMLVRYTPDETSTFDTALQYIVYKTVKTDLSFSGAERIVDALSSMQLTDHPERIALSMRPAYSVQDIAYDPEQVSEYVAGMIEPIKKRLSPNDYSGADVETVQDVLLATVAEHKNDSEFVVWAFDNHIWLQVEDEQTRDEMQYDITTRYLASLENKEERDRILGDYILEMEYRGLVSWQQQALLLLRDELTVEATTTPSP